MSEPTIVCVLGMHRSGTSLVARMMHELGLDLGPEEHLIGASSDNPTGYWESGPIKEINDEILSRLGGSWSEPPELGADWERRSELAELRRRARELIEADFSRSDLWGFKDPRSSLTLPFWQRILGTMRYVICLRNPVDIAASLAARKEDAVPFEQGVRLWLTYVRAALATTAGHPRQIVFYEDLMADPKPVVHELARLMGDESGIARQDERAAIRVALSESLWHQRTAVPNVVDSTRVAFHVKAFYLALRQFVPGAERVGPETLDLLGAYASDAGSHLARLEAGRSELKKSREEARNLKRKRVSFEQRLSERSAELERVEKERAEEQELLRGLEGELEASRAELSRLRAAADSKDSDSEQATAAPARPGHDPRLVSEIRERAGELIPSGATVLVAGKGDDALLQLDGRRGWHFPMAADGRYAGHHPSGDTAAIAQLEALRARGADHLLLPETTRWWLDHYQGLRRHLDDRYTELLRDDHCAIYRLRTEDQRHTTGPIAALKRAIASLRTHSGRDPSILDWRSGLEIAERLPEMPVFVPPGEEPVLPYLDATVDIVVVGSADAAGIAEARRVAGTAVIRVDQSSPEQTELEWLPDSPSGWGENVSLMLFPGADGSTWDGALSAFAETLDEGFAGELGVIGDPATVRAASEQVAEGGLRARPVEVPAGASLAQRARAATQAGDQPVQVFVTAPAVPLPDWLPSILALFSPDRDAGVVGTRIVSRFGALEEAGGIVAADGRRLRRGEGDSNPDRPEYCFVRRVDFCSPPVLATRQDLFERLGGFDERCVAPADALIDYALRAGQTGAGVYYQPQARLVTIGDAGQ